MTHGSRTGRIGILGGTLDPIHLGHIEAASAARQALDLDVIIVMPSRIPPHRHQEPSASVFHRFAMAALAVGGLDAFQVSDDELCADGPSYTALMLERLTARGLTRSQIFFITGSDAFAEIETWYRYPAVLDLANFVVVSRPGVATAAVIDRVPALRDRLHAAGSHMTVGTEPSVFLVDAQTPDVSSTEIRRRLRAGSSISGLVPPPVENHILRHRLYVDQPAADHLQ